MAIPVRHRGETIRIQFTIKVNGVAADLDDYSGIAVVLYFQNSQTLAKYSMNALEGYDNDNFVVIDAAAGRFDILLQPTVTIPNNQDELKAEVQVQKDDSDWEDEVWKRIVDGVTVLKLIDSKTKKLGAI